MKLSGAVSRSLRESTFWILSALALILWLSLFSYHTHDPGFSDTGEPGPVGNWIGPVGAWLSGLFLFMFGRPAYLFPVMLAYAGWLVHKDHALPEVRSRANSLLRAAGVVLTLLPSWRLATSARGRAGFPESRRGVPRRANRQGTAKGL